MNNRDDGGFMATENQTGNGGDSPPPLPPRPPPLDGGSSQGKQSRQDDSFTAQTKDDLRQMLPHLLLPVEEIKSFRWRENKKALAIAGIGLLPLCIFAFYGDPRSMSNAFWAMALYFSALWAMFFYYVFPTPEVKVSTSVLCFFGTGILAISVLLQVYRVWPLSEVISWTRADSGIARWIGYLLGVGLPEEACKAAMVIFVARRYGPLTPQALLFYGLMSGLGFGIYEGVEVYQKRQNVQYSTYIGEYYLLNVLRLTTLPFLHAIWTGMAGYFIGFSERFPERRRGLLIVAIGLPALLHGVYDALSVSSRFLPLLIALVSVLALNLYLAKSVDLERALEKRGEKIGN